MNRAAFLLGYMEKSAATEHCSPTKQVGVMNDAMKQTAEDKAEASPEQKEKEGKIHLLAKIKKEKKPEYAQPQQGESVPGPESTADKGNLT